MRERIVHIAGRFGVQGLPAEGSVQALEWMCLARLMILFLVLSFVVLQQVAIRTSSAGSSIEWGYALISLGFAFNFFYSALLNKLKPLFLIPLWQIVFDSGLTYLWIRSAAGTESLFSLFYLVQILAVALIFYRRWAIVSALAASVGFGLMTASTGLAGGTWVWLTYLVIFLTVGMVGGVLAEELKRTTLILRERNLQIERLNALQERLVANMPTGLLTVDAGLKIHFVNPAAEHILGFSSQALIGRNLLQVAPGLVPFFSQIEEETVEMEELENSQVEMAVSATGLDHHRTLFLKTRTKKGRRLQQTVEIGKGKDAQVLRGDVAELDGESGMGRLLGEDTRQGKVLLFQDVTKLVHLEEKLKQNEKLAAVGHLAAGIAHEIRNPLASMSASIEMLRGSIPPEYSDGENRKLMDIAIREIDRLNLLITEFLDFVRPEKMTFDSVDVGNVLEETCFSAKGMKEFKDRIDILTDLEKGVVAHANESKIKQVVWNLIMNAAQAMKKPGHIRVGCRTKGSQRVVFWIEDEGVGMSPEVQARLFEPFFTTKDKGTGLGLATAYKIVELHHGEIRVKSQVDVGTRFEIELPSA